MKRAAPPQRLSQNMRRLQGRITKEDIREAGLRRWDGQQRVTTDWVNLYFEPELSFIDGDCVVYLREPGQSSRGPAFTVHTTHLRSQGFASLLQQCVPQTKLHISPSCAMSNCAGCDNNAPAWALYIPAPANSGLEDTFTHHTTIRNFFAWLYQVPLAGRSLGRSLVDLIACLDVWRPQDSHKNRVEVLTYAEFQQYLDFRECPDHALAILRLAETLQLGDLWTDAFAHCVGMSHRGFRNNIEYQELPVESKMLINRARLNMDQKLERVGHAVATFFDDELHSGFLGLPEVARQHLDRFRSFLHSFYIEQHGFWPPKKFDEDVVQRLICNSLYADFRSLYLHLAETRETNSGAAANVKLAGGVCALQNVKAFDARQHLAPLPQQLPRIPAMPASHSTTVSRRQSRSSWNPLIRQREDKDRLNAERMQALIDSTNREWTLMNCLLVRRYSEFEIDSAVDELETISLADARKVRWIVVYAILQTLISITQAPNQVRNTEGLSYPLCCEVPQKMPWYVDSAKSVTSSIRTQVQLEPDTSYSHTNTDHGPGSLQRTVSKTSLVATTEPLKRCATGASTVSERRKTIAGEDELRPRNRGSSISRPKSLRRFSSGTSDSSEPPVPKLKPTIKRPAFCEIYIPGYGNGLNEVEVHANESAAGSELRSKPEPLGPPSNNASVSRESSNASSNTTWSKGSSHDASAVSTPDASPLSFSDSMSNLDLSKAKITSVVHVVETDGGGLSSVHFNSKTWDDMLNVLERRRFNITT